jgi:hypothetical protein
MSYSVKCLVEKEEKEEIRRFAIDSPSFTDLESIIQKANGNATVSLRYFDGEDWCLIESDQELSEAFNVVDGKTLKIKVAQPEVVGPEITEPNNLGEVVESEVESTQSNQNLSFPPLSFPSNPSNPSSPVQNSEVAWQCSQCTLNNSSVPSSNGILLCELCEHVTLVSQEEEEVPAAEEGSNPISALESVSDPQNGPLLSVVSEDAADSLDMVPEESLVEPEASVVSEESLVVQADEGPQHDMPCKLCGNSIVGDRFKCILCFNTDMCSSCQVSHPVEHPLILAKSVMDLPARPPSSWFFKRAEIAPPLPPLTPTRCGNNRVPCRYWAACYRKNPVHLARFLHPDDEEEGKKQVQKPAPMTSGFVDSMDAFYAPIDVVAPVDVAKDAAASPVSVSVIEEVQSTVEQDEEVGWVCTTCTYRNHESTQGCEVCSSPRPWTCDRCTFVNAGSSRHCGVCRF